MGNDRSLPQAGDFSPEVTSPFDPYSDRFSGRHEFPVGAARFATGGVGAASLRDALSRRGRSVRVAHVPGKARTWALLACMGALVACESSPSGAERSTGALRVVADERGFSPKSLPLPKGGPGSTASVTFVRTTDATCATEVVIPDLNVKKGLPLNQSVAIDVPTDTARTLTFQCGMGMYKGALVVH